MPEDNSLATDRCFSHTTALQSKFPWTRHLILPRFCFGPSRIPSVDRFQTQVAQSVTFPFLLITSTLCRRQPAWCQTRRFNSDQISEIRLFHFAMISSSSQRPTIFSIIQMSHLWWETSSSQLKSGCGSLLHLVITLIAALHTEVLAYLFLNM